MGKVKLFASVVLNRYVSKFRSDIISTDKHVLYCKMCEIKIKFEKKV